MCAPACFRFPVPAGGGFGERGSNEPAALPPPALQRQLSFLPERQPKRGEGEREREESSARGLGGSRGARERRGGGRFVCCTCPARGSFCFLMKNSDEELVAAVWKGGGRRHLKNALFKRTILITPPPPAIISPGISCCSSSSSSWKTNAKRERGQ